MNYSGLYDSIIANIKAIIVAEGKTLSVVERPSNPVGFDAIATASTPGRIHAIVEISLNERDQDSTVTQFGMTAIIFSVDQIQAMDFAGKISLSLHGLFALSPDIGDIFSFSGPTEISLPDSSGGREDSARRRNLFAYMVKANGRFQMTDEI